MSVIVETLPQKETKTQSLALGLKNTLTPCGEFPVLSSMHGAIREIESRIELIANSHVPIFITGESGTGKEVVARLVHQKSGKTPFVAINCAALPKDVIENELFGHEKGAFTGALMIKSGCFELANGGTLFLDEIAEMHPQTQAKLLRAIETKSFRRLGGRDEISVDARIIAATNKEPMAAMKSGLLREDLFYRLSVIELNVPPLRERPADILPLLEHYMVHLSKKYDRTPKRFSKKSLHYLESFDWPGNIRELRNLVERLVLICPDQEIQPGHLPPRMLRKEGNPAQVSIPVGTSLDEAEKILIERTLEHTKDNKAKAARMLGVSRKTLYDKLKSVD
jgi:DNA-binding NtrC family response regulator